MNEVLKTKRRVISNKEKIIKTVNRYPGLRFHQIKTQTKIANGTVQHHLDQLVKLDIIKVIIKNKFHDIMPMIWKIKLRLFY